MSTTHNDMPMCECPRCGHKWQQDDWYDVKAGDDWDCPKCEATLIVADVWQIVTVELKAAEAAEREGG